MSPRRPASRRKVLASAVLGVALIGGLVAGAELLRYPHAGDTAVTAPDPAETEVAPDIRDPIDCPEPLPREGQERDERDPPGGIARRTSNELYDCPETHDGRRVRYRGEVVGAVLRRREGAWVHLNDDIYADVGPLPAHRDYRGGNGGVGVLIPHELADEITFVGGPRTRGDILEVVGVFHRVDETTGEVAVLRATEGTATPGEPLRRPTLPARRAVAVVAALLMIAVVAGEHRHKRRAAA